MNRLRVLKLLSSPDSLHCTLYNRAMDSNCYALPLFILNTHREIPIVDMEHTGKTVLLSTGMCFSLSETP